jgi:hypothetical protein
MSIADLVRDGISSVGKDGPGDREEFREGKKEGLYSGVFSILEPSFVFLMRQPFYYQGNDLCIITGN